jgi:hypothetical protein
MGWRVQTQARGDVGPNRRNRILCSPDFHAVEDIFDSELVGALLAGYALDTVKNLIAARHRASLLREA